MTWKVKYRGTAYETRWNKLQEGTYNFDYLNRAAGSLEGLFVHDYKEAMYYSTYIYECYIPPTVVGVPGTGEFFNSSNQYVVHFDDDKLPTFIDHGFWSITMYGPDFQLVDNEINRYAICNTTQGIQFNDNGSLDLYFQADEPQDSKEASNWLPCPKQKDQQTAVPTELSNLSAIVRGSESW